MPPPVPMHSQSGVALVLVLACLVLLTVVVISLMVGATQELNTAKSYSEQVQSRRLAASTLELVKGQIWAATTETTNSSWASQPGAIRTFRSGDTNLVNVYKLYSSDTMVVANTNYNPTNDWATNWASLPNEFVDLNRPVVVGGVTNYPIFNPAATNSVAGFAVTNAPGATTANPLPMPVRWVYVLRNGLLTNYSGATNYDASNPVVGRIAFWTDDDTCKININTASAAREGEKNGTTNTMSFWDLPYGDVTNETILARYQPVQREFQRYPGHPARVDLKTVLANMTASQIYDMTPRISSDDATNGSFGGTIFAQTNGAITLKQERLYATLDEFFYNTNRTANNTNVTSTNLNRLEGFLTAYNRAPEINIFGRPRISMWPINADSSKRTPLDNWFAICSTMVYGNGNSVTGTNLFAVTRSIATNATSDLTVSGATIPKLFTYLQNQTKEAPPGYSSSFLDKYKAAGRDQLLALSLDYIRCVNLYDTSVTNATYQSNAFNTNAFALPQTNQSLDGTRKSQGKAHIPSLPGYGQVVPLRISPTTVTNSSGTFNGLGRFDTTISEAALHFWALSWNGPHQRLITTTTNNGIVTTDEEVNNWSETAFYYFSATTNTTAGPTNVVLSSDEKIALNTVREDDRIVTSTNTNVVGINYVTPDTFVQLATNRWKPLITRDTNGNITNYPTNATIISNSPTFFVTTHTNASSVVVTNYHFPPFTSASSTNTNYTARSTYIIPGTGAPMYAAQLLIAPFNTMFGYNRYAADYLHRVTGLSTFKINNINVFPSSVNGKTTDPAVNWVRQWEFASDLGGAANFIYTLQNSSNGDGKYASFLGGTITNITSPFQQDYPFVSRIFPIATNSALDFSGGNLKLEILSRAGDVIQTLNLNFPQANNIAKPTPIVEPVYAGQRTGTDNYNNQYQGRRMRSAGYEPAGQSGQICFQGDTMISVEANGPATDYRWLSLQTNATASLFQSHPLYSSTTATSNKACGLRLDGMQEQISGTTPTGTKYSLNANTNSHMFSSSGSLIGNTNALGRKLPVISSFYTTNGIKNAQGKMPDFETGFADFPDGAYSRKSDEGQLVAYQFANINTNYLPYYSGWANWSFGESTYFSPNRQVPSPGIMGGLPSRGTETNGGWETLLFCPNPAAGTTSSDHRGFASPPDYLWMDLFNMPIVEPYAISEPFSTAGKINMNYKIVPFTYVTRSTGLRAVLRANRVSAMTNSSSDTYPARYPIHLDETLKDFEWKFNNNQIFKSASEISSMWLYPANLTNSTNRLLTAESAGTNTVISNWWYTTSSPRILTGDNLREQPYTVLYQNLTTQANTYTVHVYVQALDQATSGKLIVTGEYRGSYALERFLDPKSPNLPDFTDPTKPNAMGYYQFRVNNTTQFLP